MTFDFRKAFKQGIDAAEDTAKKNAEIDQVFYELNQQIKSATKDRIEIHIESRTNNLAALASMFSPESGHQAKALTYIVAENHKTGAKEDLASWERAPSAYPCKITYSDQVQYCGDKESLELQLSEMLSHPNTGKKMFKLLESQN